MIMDRSVALVPVASGYFQSPERVRRNKAMPTNDDTHNKSISYPGPSRIHLSAFPPKERWDDWTELDSQAWPHRKERHYQLVPTTCFNCESACGLLAYIDKDTNQIQKFEGNPENPGSRGRNCAKGPATLNQVSDPDRILYPLKRAGKRGEGKWERVSWDQVLDDLASRIRKAIVEDRRQEIMYHVGRPGEDGFTERIWRPGALTVTTRTRTFALRARAKAINLWMGLDRPSPDHANAKVILLISAHLESGHYFNPHAQRIIDGKAGGAKLIVMDTRLSNTATHADVFIAPYPGIGSCDSFINCELPDSEQSLQSRVCEALVELGRVFRSRGQRSEVRSQRSGRGARAPSGE
jgi:anaerobic selenocysteine-containing dehydrogenase